MDTPGLYNIACYCFVVGTGQLASPSYPVFVLPYGRPVGVAFASQPGPVSLYSDPGVATVVYEMASYPMVRLVDSAMNTIMGFTGFFRATTGVGTTGLVLGEGDAFTFWATNGMASLTGLYMTLNPGIDANGTASINVGSSCCSLLAFTATNPSQGFDLTANPTQLSLAFSLPSPLSAGNPFALTARVLPALATGSPVAAYASNITCTLLLSPSGTPSSPGTLTGPTTRTASAGVAIFTPLVVTTPGTYTLSCTAPLPGYNAASLAAASAALTVVTGPARALKFTVQPSGCLGGTPCSTQPRVALVDGSGNAVAAAGVIVALTLSTTPAYPGPEMRSGGIQAVLAGTVTSATDATGVAMIPSMSISYAGSGYRLVASAGGLASATSAEVDVAVGAVERTTIVRDASGLTAR